MHLSRLELNPRDRRVRHDLADCQELHRTLLSVWPRLGPGAPARAVCGLLYRVEASSHSDDHGVLVQSVEPPAWDALPAGYLIRHATKQVDGLFASLQAGARLRFRLRANPTRRVSRQHGRSDDRLVGKRVDLRREDEQIAWLERKGRDQCGFRIERLRLVPEVPNIRLQPEPNVMGRRAGARITFGSVLFDGELSITDAELFQGALQNGVGSGKAYGFGLLSVAPAGG